MVRTGCHWYTQFVVPGLKTVPPPTPNLSNTTISNKLMDRSGTRPWETERASLTHTTVDGIQLLRTGSPPYSHPFPSLLLLEQIDLLLPCSGPPPFL